MHTHVHRVVVVTIVEHPPGNGGRGVFTVGEHTDFSGALYQGLVECRPGAPCERHHTQVVIGHHQAVGQYLQRIERGIEHHVCFRQFALDGIGESEEEGVAGGKDDDMAIMMRILLEDGIDGCCDINPLSPFRQ